MTQSRGERVVSVQPVVLCPAIGARRAAWLEGLVDQCMVCPESAYRPGGSAAAAVRGTLTPDRGATCVKRTRNDAHADHCCVIRRLNHCFSQQSYHLDP